MGTELGREVRELPADRARPMWRAVARLTALVVVALILGACEVDVTVDVVIDDSGSGVVAVAVGLDEEAMVRLGDPAMLEVDDLLAAGWVLEPPEVDGTTTWLRATKAFDDPDGFAAVLDEVAGPGLFEAWDLTVQRSALSVDWSVTGQIDPTALADVLDDAELEAALGIPIAEVVADIERSTGRSVDDMVSVSVSVALPDGTTESWTASPSGQVLVVDVSASRVLPIATEGSLIPVVGMVALGAFVVVGLLALRRRRRVTPLP